LKKRLVAASLHFLASVIVISLSLYVIYFIWYPKPFYTIHSVFEAVKIVLSVDLILGPFLMLVIYNQLKPRKELVRDILVIIIFQISALFWGLHITYKMRPIFFVFQADTFYPVTKEEVDLNDLSSNISAPGIWQTPKMIYIEPLKGKEAVQRMKGLSSGVKIQGEMYQTSKYKALSLQKDSEYQQDVIKQAMNSAFLLQSQVWKPGVEKLIATQGGEIEDYLFYPVVNDRFFRGLIAFNKDDFSVAGLVSDF
jgi:hypothetical protein